MAKRAATARPRNVHLTGEIKHFEVPAPLYPFVITAHRRSNGEEVWRRVVEKNHHTEVYIPPLARQFGETVEIRIAWGDGTVSTGFAAPGP